MLLSDLLWSFEFLLFSMSTAHPKRGLFHLPGPGMRRNVKQNQSNPQPDALCTEK